MLSLKYIVAVFIVISLFLAIYFQREAPGDAPQIKSTIPGYRAGLANNSYFAKKLSELDYLESNNVKKVIFELSDTPQRTSVAKRANAAGQPEESLSYSFDRPDAETAKYILYVNRGLLNNPSTDELEQQYSQLALIALVQTTPHENTESHYQRQLSFIRDYRADMDNNAIFSIKK